ncbi:CDP-glucose 4,6-dehydratase [Paenibacillus sp. GYB004]|uniref:CDP-glucose 4,6-dehydratase n=1 Tax=Paenibacillus sp. GYB004 TaxID=2994393 RepID=UPI002F96AA46
MESLGVNFWSGKRVFLTGHTGFKGAWLSLWLQKKGAIVTGYSLQPPTNPSIFDICKIDEIIFNSIIGDIRDSSFLMECVKNANPDIVIHMAAQPLVRKSYIEPVETYETNVMGTVNILEAVKATKSVKVFLNVTTDKCYENKEWVWGYRENETLGGYDPYSNSKACSEMVTSAYRNSFFTSGEHVVAVASARAGNVIGGGDWAKDRLVPDIIRSLLKNKLIEIRNPRAIRPWQYVLEPLSGYMLLCQKLYEHGPDFASSWNFGPEETDVKTVEWIAERLVDKWGDHRIKVATYQDNHYHEATLLKLDCSKAKSKLQWAPRWNIDKALEQIVEWVRVYADQGDILDICYRQISEYENQ